MTSVDVELGLTALAAMLSPTTLTFSVLALVLGKRPGRTGFWFFLSTLFKRLSTSRHGRRLTHLSHSRENVLRLPLSITEWLGCRVRKTAKMVYNAFQ